MSTRNFSQSLSFPLLRMQNHSIKLKGQIKMNIPFRTNLKETTLECQSRIKCKTRRRNGMDKDMGTI